MKKRAKGIARAPVWNFRCFFTSDLFRISDFDIRIYFVHSCRDDPRLSGEDEQPLTGRDADRLAGLGDDGRAAGKNAGRPDDPLRADAGRRGSAGECTTGHDIRCGERYDRLAAHRYARERRGRLRRSCMHAGDDRADVNNGTRHRIRGIFRPRMPAAAGSRASRRTRQAGFQPDGCRADRLEARRPSQAGSLTSVGRSASPADNSYNR